MKKAKVNWSSDASKNFYVEIPDGSKIVYSKDKNEKIEVNGKKYRVIKVVKDGYQVGVIDRETKTFIQTLETTSKPPEEKETIIVPPLSYSCTCDKEEIPEAPYRETPITDEEIGRIVEHDTSIVSEEFLCKKEGKIKAFFKRIFRIK